MLVVYIYSFTTEYGFPLRLDIVCEEELCAKQRRVQLRGSAWDVFAGLPQ